MIRSKKWVIIVLIFLVMLIFLAFVPIPNYSGAYVGMSYEDFYNLFPDGKVFHYYEYSFYKNTLGDYVVARKHNNQIIELKCIRKLTTNPSKATFNSIKDGTDLLDVVAMVGIPYDSFTSGALSCVFRCNDGNNYSIYWLPVKTDEGIKYVSSGMRVYQN